MLRYVIMVSALLAGSAHAETFIESLLPSEMKQAQKPVSKDGCADFEGTWSGICVTKTDHSETRGVEFDISQFGCSVLAFKNELIAVGGSQSSQFVQAGDGENPSRSVNSSSSADWNADKTAVSIHGGTAVRPIGAVGGAHVMYTATLTKLNDKTIRLKMQAQSGQHSSDTGCLLGSK